MNSRSKGARGERAAAQEWAEVMGGSARRGQQFHGGQDSPDVVTSFPLIHLEVKRVERGNPYDWIDQAARDAGPKVPVVMHRRNRREWLVIMRLTDAPRFCQSTSVTSQAEKMGIKAVPIDPFSTGLPANQLPG